MTIPVADIFAGPGGLGEGFASLTEHKKRLFNIALSIEKDIFAHQTLLLRSFFRQFESSEVPREYYFFLRGKITLEQLFVAFPKQAAKTKKEVWLAELGKELPENVDRMIRRAISRSNKWVLIGGPPCQAYSLVGRSRRGGIDPKDSRVYLYREYYRILAVHNPPVFIMENVKGLLSAEIRERKIIEQILADLSDPVAAYRKLNGNGMGKLSCPGYKIYSLVTPGDRELDGTLAFTPDDFVIRAEDFGIPQSRHRLILLGIRTDIDILPSLLTKKKEQVKAARVLKGLPRLRGGLSEEIDSAEQWRKALAALLSNGLLHGSDGRVAAEVKRIIRNLRSPECDRGSEFVTRKPSVSYSKRWYLDPSIEGTCNHSSRSHMTSDLFRYVFAACYAKVNGVSPKLSDFPSQLLPDHRSVEKDVSESNFADRFRVQLWNEPARTITSHISKDGHYYIHPDPSQCRSLTVREAARLQTFPDNYYFCGPRTSQYVQVGNAVPPLLALQIARIVSEILHH
ncbi:MAG: DNA cytosine methyltransferase [Ignavibacteriae bacterium]|nr:DNA cytosine methyltransferase [Ignavibacteriota bacterium]